jgi:rubrerythrin
MNGALQIKDESWTARKAFRRFLEHEREHLGQVEEILAAYRGREK